MPGPPNSRAICCYIFAVKEFGKCCCAKNAEQDMLAEKRRLNGLKKNSTLAAFGFKGNVESDSVNADPTVKGPGVRKRYANFEARWEARMALMLDCMYSQITLLIVIYCLFPPKQVYADLS
ncbi:hypothetical protein CYMTET_12466 [Cymbomonas tetramitiformis]|uniref:Uncharacterized protein n=1 Tax=Cymbomonas tetramitiformis TaxID=36881 RepID=A0AAE0GJZ8_9CHLO|nr:hypothetical protein CYMTET_12466 [Cymbomonas tetramitiformis]